MALTYVGSAIVGCGDSDSYVVTAPGPNGGQVGGLGTASSTTTITENATNGFQFQLQPLDDSLRALDANGQVRFSLDAAAAPTDSVLNFPQAADSGPDGRSYVVSSGDSQVVLFDADGRVQTRLGDAEGLLYPSDVAFHSESGELFVADPLNHRVVIYDANGTFLRTFGTVGEEPGQLNGPGAIDLAADGTLWVADLGNQRLQRFSRQGESLQVVGGYGTDPGQFLSLSDVAVDPENGDLYTCDQVTGCITIFDSRGNFDFRFRVLDDNGQLASVIDISVDEEAIYLYLADNATVYDDLAFADELVVS